MKTFKLLSFFAFYSGASRAQREGPYWLHIKGQTNTSIDGYAYRTRDGPSASFTYDPSDTGHDVRMNSDSHFMIYQYRDPGTARVSINLLSYSNPQADVPDPEDPNPGAAYLRFRHFLQSTLSYALFQEDHEKDTNDTWPVQAMAVQPRDMQLGVNSDTGTLAQHEGVDDRFLSYWHICWMPLQDADVTVWSSLYWSPVALTNGEDCNSVNITLEEITK